MKSTTYLFTSPELTKVLLQSKIEPDVFQVYTKILINEKFQEMLKRLLPENKYKDLQSLDKDKFQFAQNYITQRYKMAVSFEKLTLTVMLKDRNDTSKDQYEAIDNIVFNQAMINKYQEFQVQYLKENE